MKNKVLIVLAVLIIAGLTISVSSADPKQCRKGEPEKLFVSAMAGPKSCGDQGPCCLGFPVPMCQLLKDPEFVEKLELTPEQVGKLKKLHFEHQKKMITLRSGLQMKKLELMDLLEGEKLDKNLIRQKAKELAAVKVDLALEKLEMKLTATDVLTKEQLDTMKKIKHECREEKIIKRIEKMEKPLMMMKHGCQPGGGTWTDDEDVIRMLPSDDDEDDDEGEDIEIEVEIEE